MRYILFVIFIFVIQSCINQKITQNNVFNPTKEYELNDNFSFERNFIQNSDTIKIEYWYLTEKNAQYNLIYFSGNGSNIRSAIPFFNELGNQFDLNIYSFNYSGYGLSEGTPSIKGIINDGKTALDFFQNKIGDKNLPTILLGYSLGGFVALNHSNNDLIDQVILLSTFTSSNELVEYLQKEALPGIVRPFLKLEIDESVYQLNNIDLIHKIKKPVLFIHGGADEFIPPSMSYKLYNLSGSDKKEIKIIDNADHRMVLKDSIFNKQVIKEIKEFILL